MGWEPRGRDFPRRNRIISGLVLRNGRGRGGAPLRLADHRALRPGAEPRGLRGPGLAARSARGGHQRPDPPGRDARSPSVDPRPRRHRADHRARRGSGCRRPARPRPDLAEQPDFWDEIDLDALTARRRAPVVAEDPGRDRPSLPTSRRSPPTIARGSSPCWDRARSAPTSWRARRASAPGWCRPCCWNSNSTAGSSATGAARSRWSAAEADPRSASESARCAHDVEAALQDVGGGELVHELAALAPARRRPRSAPGSPRRSTGARRRTRAAGAGSARGCARRRGSIAPAGLRCRPC